MERLTVIVSGCLLWVETVSSKLLAADIRLLIDGLNCCRGWITATPPRPVIEAGGRSDESMTVSYHVPWTQIRDANDGNRCKAAASPSLAEDLPVALASCATKPTFAHQPTTEEWLPPSATLLPIVIKPAQASCLRRSARTGLLQIQGELTAVVDVLAPAVHIQPGRAARIFQKRSGIGRLAHQHGGIAVCAKDLDGSPGKGFE